ncbi:MAG: DUF4168 domain-containing protein [Burkholderiales bacterium]|nr:DUF4168 domain-containing protein [Burkholderiales bacterium]
MSRSKFLAIVAVALLGIGPVSFTHAQDAPVAPGKSVNTYSDGELKSFAEAMLEVQRINMTYQPQMESAKTPEEKDRVQQAAMQEAIQAVEGKGMPVDKYQEILLVAQNDPVVADKIRQHIKNVQ